MQLRVRESSHKVHCHGWLLGIEAGPDDYSGKAPYWSPHIICSQCTAERKRGQQSALLLLLVPSGHQISDASVVADGGGPGRVQ